LQLIRLEIWAMLAHLIDHLLEQEISMAKHSSMPSLAALLGLVAVAGYQNRDKIGEFVKGMTDKAGAAADGAAPTGGLGSLVDSFRKSGLGQKADSWVGTGANEPVTAPEVEQGVGGDVIDGLAKQTGLSREELLKRLAAVLPDVVDKMTPAGRV
jgi:uncharacterized protein YidB (DUF937 family)